VPEVQASFEVVLLTLGDPHYAEARDLRFRVLYEPLGLPRDLVEDTDGRGYEHLAAIAPGGGVVGYARLHLEGGESQAYQVAVDDAWRARGVGAALMRAVERRARAAGRDSVQLDARETAVGFYERLGYAAIGEPFLSARTGTPHRRMRRAL
jgi:predicted GNAT family N-acyltransferase